MPRSNPLHRGVSRAMRMTPKDHDRAVRKQDFRRRAAEVGGSVLAGCAMLKSEGTPESIARRADAAVARWMARKLEPLTMPKGR